MSNTDYPRVIREYAESGNMPIISEVFGVEAEAHEVAAEHPDMAFLMRSSFKEDSTHTLQSSKNTFMMPRNLL